MMIRYVATNVRLWRDGELFGIGSSCISVFLWLDKEVSGLSTQIDQFQNSLVATVTALNDESEWFGTLWRAWQFGVASTIFHVGTSLAVLFSV